MQFIELAVTNFKRFSEERFRFSPGLNVIWGTNEAGKSTVHKAICCALFGRERSSVVENWNGGVCSVDLIYRNGRNDFKVERQFSSGASRLGMLIDGELSDVSTARDDISSMIAQHLGVSSRSVFEHTVCVRQTCISRADVRDLEDIGGEIQRVLTGTAHTSAAEAQRRLEERRDAVKGRARPANPREYDKIAVRLRELAEQLADARQSRRKIGELAEELEHLESRTSCDGKRIEVLRDLLERHKKWSELAKRLAEMDAVHADVFSTARKIGETIDRLESVQKELANCTDLVDKDDEIADHLSKIESRRRELESRLGEFSTIEDDVLSGGGKPAPGWIPAIALLFLAAGLVCGLVFGVAWYSLLVPGVALTIVYVHRRATIRASQAGQIADLRQSAQAELTQLDSEEGSLLSYVKCGSIQQAFARVKTYRSLASHSRELEAALSALLNGRKITDWEAQETELARKTSAMRAELNKDFPGYSPSTEEAESWRAEFASLQASLPRAEARMHEVRGSLEAERRNAKDLASMEGEIEYLHRRKAELDFLHKAYDEAINALQAVTQTVSEEYLPILSAAASRFMERVTSGRYTSVQITPGWQLSVDGLERTGVAPGVLSIGTLDQLYFALRVACAELLSSGPRLPFVLDDPFPSFDRERMDRALDVVQELACDHQVILLTHDEYILQWAEALSDSCTIHRLAKP